MPLKDVKASSEELQMLEQVQQRQKRERELLREQEDSRTSEVRAERTSDGTLWGYVVLDNSFARIDFCETNCSVLEIPEQLGGFRVAELGVDSCTSLDCVERIVCPDSIAAIGRAAFRRNPALSSLVLPQHMEVFDATWVRDCPRLQHLVLPGELTRIDASLFYNGMLRTLVVGPGMRDVVPGAFTPGHLEHIEIDERNPYLFTDGHSIISRDGTRLVALAVPVESYRVPDTCTVVGKKAFSGRSELKRIELPANLKSIEAYGLARTGLREFTAPAGLERLEERALYRCTALEQATLNEGLRYIGDHAFDGTALSELVAPASIEDIGVRIVADRIMDFSGPHAGFSIAAGAQVMSIDEHGGLYRHLENGTHFVRMLDSSVSEYAIAKGTRIVDERAFARHKALKSVSIPEGVEVIDPYAFKDCSSLAHVDFPSTLRAIGEEAFMDTVLEEAQLPAALERLGSCAFVTIGLHHADMPTSLRSIEVEAGNERFFTDQGMLCERIGENSIQVVVFTDSCSRVVLPQQVTRVCDFAFNGARRLREFSLSEGIRSVGKCALAVSSSLELLHIDLVRPVEGHDHFDLRFPPTERSAHEISLAFSTTSWINVEKIIRHYDNAIVNIHDYSTRDRADIDFYAQVNRMIERLEDPVLMTSVNRSMYDKLIEHNLERFCIAAARNDDRHAIDVLAELGYITSDNIDAVVDAVGVLQDAATTSHLLEIKRRCFGRAAIDFDL